MAQDEKLANVPLMRMNSGPSTYVVHYGENATVRITAHEALVDAPQPVLRFHKFRWAEVEVEYYEGIGKNKELKYATEEQIVGDFVGAVNAGAWIAFFAESEIVEPALDEGG